MPRATLIVERPHPHSVAHQHDRLRDPLDRTDQMVDRAGQQAKLKHLRHQILALASAAGAR